MARNLVLIDDDPEDIELIVDAVRLIKADYKCTTFVDACVALSHLEASDEIPDLVIIDINMPKMNGHECLSALRKIAKLKNVRVALHSSAFPGQKTLALFEQQGAK